MWLKKESEKTYRYYYERMGGNYKACYEKILNAVLSFEKTVELPLMEAPVCGKIYKQFISDNPIFFYVQKIGIIVSRSDTVIVIYYLMTENEAADALMVMKSAVESVKYACRFYSELEKEEYIHSYLVENVKYELTDSLPVHGAHSVFIHKKAVCDGISEAAKILLDSVGIRSMVITGYLNHSDKPRSGFTHAWNIVWISDKPYHVDFTTDNNLSEGSEFIRHDYFNLSDEQIRKDHLFENVGIYAAFTNDWYRINNLYFATEWALRAYIRSGIRQGKKVFGFRLPFTQDPHKKIEEIKRLISEEIGEANAAGYSSCSMAVNIDQMVAYVWF